MPVITLFDKSFLQSLNPNQALFFDKFFLSVVAPIFHAETLADLEKAVREGRTPEEEVGFIANKMPELNIAVCANHQGICVNSFLGSETPMDGRVPRARGKHVQVAGQPALVYRSSPEEEAYDRWMQRDFLGVERKFAKYWRRAIQTDISKIAQVLDVMGVDAKKCKTLEDVKDTAVAFARRTERPLDRLNLAVIMLGIPSHLEDKVYSRWKEAGFPPLTEYAPYAGYAFTIALFFHIGVAARLLNRDDQMDITYLFYLPFCSVFVSSDKLHRRSAPLFLRSDQEFVWGPDLRQNLTNIVDHYLKQPEELKEKGIWELAPWPPEEVGGLAIELYDRHLAKDWREKLKGPELPPQVEQALVEHIKSMDQAPEIPSPEVRSIEDVSMMKVERFIRKRRGDFYQVGKDVPPYSGA